MMLYQAPSCDKIEPVTTVFAGLFYWPVREPYNRTVGHKAPVFSAHPGTVVTDVQASLRIREFCVMSAIQVLDKTVVTRWTANTKEYYERKGYAYTGMHSELVVHISDLHPGSTKRVTVRCPRCKKIRTVQYRHVIQRKHTRCNPCSSFVSNFINLAGRHFERLVVVSFEGQDRWRDSLWLCRCDCGTEKVIAGNSLRRGATTSCGCYNMEIITEAWTGETNPRFDPDTPENEKNKRHDSTSARYWREAVKKRFNYQCIVCNSTESLVAHHLFAWSACPEKRTDESNGVCLCESCHKCFHAEHGYGDNSPRQFWGWYRRVLEANR